MITEIQGSCPFINVDSCPYVHVDGEGCPYLDLIEKNEILIPEFCPWKGLEQAKAQNKADEQERLRLEEEARIKAEEEEKAKVETGEKPPSKNKGWFKKGGSP